MCRLGWAYHDNTWNMIDDMEDDWNLAQFASSTVVSYMLIEPNPERNIQVSED